MSIILQNIRRFQTLKLLKFQGVRYNKHKSYIQYLEKMNIIENDPISVYIEILNRNGDTLSKYINDLDRASYNDIYISDNDISQVNKDESLTNQDRDTNKDTSVSSNNPDK